MASIRPEFKKCRLNKAGERKSDEIAELFSETLSRLEAICGTDGRDMAIVRTKLQEAKMFSVRGMAERIENQFPIEEPTAGSIEARK